MRASPVHEVLSHPRMPGDERRRQLIEVSIDLFAKKGFSGTTTKEIAAAAGVTEAIIFRHFATKQELYTAIIEHMCSRKAAEEWWRATETLMERNDDEGVIRYLMNAIVDFARVDPRYERLMLFAALEGNEMALMQQNAFSGIGERLTEYIRRRQRDGALVSSDPHLIMCIFVGALKFYASRKYLFGCWADTDDHLAVDELARMVLNGIRAKRDVADAERVPADAERVNAEGGTK